VLKIKATVKVINRVKVVCPDDGVHVVGKDGIFIKGVHSLWFNDKLIPKGQTAFYWYESGSTGLRVSYSFGWLKPIAEKIVRQEYKTMRACWKMGISPEPFGIENVRLDLYYEHEKKKINCKPYAIRVQNIAYPEEAWRKYAKGYPYDWTACNHPDHSPEGFRRFVADAKANAGKLISTSWKLGDVVWCAVNNRWYLVDCGK